MGYVEMTAAEFDARMAEVRETLLVVNGQLDDLVAVVERYRGALDAIAEDDKLVAESPEAFGLHAYRRCRDVARWALNTSP